MNKLFPWVFVPLLINYRLNVSKISDTKCAFFNYFNWCFIWAKIHIYNTPLSYVTELFNLFKPSFLLIPIKIHLKVTPFALNIAIFFKEYAILNKSRHLLKHALQIWIQYLKKTNSDRAHILLMLRFFSYICIPSIPLACNGSYNFF